MEPSELQGMARTELEVLSAELDDHNTTLDDFLSPEEGERVEAAALEVAATPEALATIRTARDKLGPRALAERALEEDAALED